MKFKIPEKFDGILITSTVNQRYLTGFNYTDGYVILTRNKCYLFADSRYIEAARAKANKDYIIVLYKGKRTELFGDIFRNENIHTLGYEDNTLTCGELSRLKSDFSNILFEPVGNFTENLREFKNPIELDNIIKAQCIAEQAFEHILGFINRERTEQEVALELEFYMRSHGAEAASFDVIAVSGSASSLPHGVPRNIKLENGFLTMDFGALYNGYCSDMTRTICLGKADDKQKYIYDIVLNAQLAALDACKVGAKCADIDKIARDVITKVGYGDCFGHGLGHGVGLQIHEAPRLSAGAGEALLTNGHVVTVEPGIYIEGLYGVRIEDMVAVVGEDCVNLTHSPKNLIELC